MWYFLSGTTVSNCTFFTFTNQTKTSNHPFIYYSVIGDPFIYYSVIGDPFIGVMVIVFSDTFNNISVISWWSVLFVEETGVPGENH
jgi:hypothetical protein